MHRDFAATQRHRTLHHEKLPQPKHVSEEEDSSSELHRTRPHHSFVVCADTQLGMTSENREWETELAISRKAVDHINALEPRPLFCCCCGDLVDMESTFHEDRPKSECEAMQDEQNRDFQEVWDKLHPDIAMVCLCGNHDVGNRPTKYSIQRFNNAFGDDYLGFWANGTYNMAINSCLFSDPVAAIDEYHEQLVWIEKQLSYARKHDASQIFVYSHHPWFLYHEDEIPEDMNGFIPYPESWGIPVGGFPDSYFHIKPKYRSAVMKLFKKYRVDAAFCGHFHQNMVSTTSFGMDMIITGPLSWVFESNGKPKHFDEPAGLGIRVVNATVPNDGEGDFTHEYQLLESKK